ncbi:hypothetical protein NPIL_684871 [Nephila pilipes]|uniref:Uncharacterized protein n=1 Tax=Nephila pilipes TaxID=299642 RepID=A0A8X6N7L0_NEPPI|nr:hypothetical protein NPIL_684871 [Nephila pilipes]
MEFIILPEEKQNSTLSQNTSSDFGHVTKREATSSDFHTETEVSDNCDVIPPCRNMNHHTPGSPRILRTGKIGHPRQKYCQLSKITDCFKTITSDQEALAGPNKIAHKNAMKKEYDAVIKENE